MSRRITVALLVANLEDNFTNAVCQGAIEAAEQEDINLVIVPGKYIGLEVGDDVRQIYEYQHNLLFSYAKGRSVDVVVSCAGSIGYSATEKERREFIRQFEGMHLITLASRVDDNPYIMFDNKSGLRKGIEELIRKRKCTRLGMVAGSKENEDAMERLEVFKSVLRMHNLPVDDSCIVYGDCTHHSEAAVEELLAKKPDLDGIVCMNDATAMAVYKVLGQHKIEVGKQMPVIGFDDVEFAAQLDPPLATVRADAAELGRCGVMEAIHLLRRGEVSNYYVPTKFVPRESLYGKPRKQLLQNHKRSLDSDFYKNKLFAYRSRMEDINHIVNYIARDMLMFEESPVYGEYASILQQLHMLEIHNSYLYVYEHPIINQKGTKWIKPERIMLRAVEKNGKVVSVPVDRQSVKTEDLVTRAIEDGSRHTYVTMNLYSNDKTYGIFICDLDLQYFSYFELINFQLSAAVKMIDLLHQNKRVQTELEDTLEVLRQNNVNLDKVSKIDELTGIYNRRGFLMEASDLLQHKSEKTFIYMIYADLDYLKKINDVYGHEEGDFAIKSCAVMLKQMMSVDGIIGRIGGDEFCGMFLSNRDDGEEWLRANLTRIIEKFNADCNKAYHVRMSMGVLRKSCSVDITIDELMKQADELLYIQKKNRTVQIMEKEKNLR